MCIVPMFVITARSGCAMRVSTDSSPKWFIPISSTAASQSRLQPQDADRQADLIVIILFRPLRAQCRAQDGGDHFLRRRLAPTLPVMPTQRHGRLSR